MTTDQVDAAGAAAQARAPALPEPGALDVSAFSQQDLVNLVLQRSDVLGYSRPAYDMVRGWEAGDEAPLRAAVAENGTDYARAAAGIIRDEFLELQGLIRRFAPRRIADIGCGYAIFDLYAWHATGCELLLIDIEETEQRHFGFESEGAGYSSLETARRFLTDNGVPDSAIRTWNPSQEDMPALAPLDMVFSFLSCGFHYPVDMYMPFFELAVRKGGAVVLDLRGHLQGEISRQLSALGRVREIGGRPGVRRVMLKRGAGL
jgi:SAM-dependent methyltransferase